MKSTGSEIKIANGKRNQLKENKADLKCEIRVGPSLPINNFSRLQTNTDGTTDFPLPRI